ncbi:hypothetical protein [Dyella sp. 2RAB6]|uniref:hypothetical protein n=1 Tax=Dyella sp. 2RAB6 TaxID=3232992 RepID=UPI003F8FC1F4
MQKTPARLTGNRVDWDDERLSALLKKTESWTLDNRDSADPLEVQLHVGWGASSGRHASLVWERDQAVVLVTAFVIAVGQHVRIDRHVGEEVRSAWGVVVDGREGFRAEDREAGAWVHWVHVR